ncbi:MAG TPA: ABC transporter ATP-binding protein [Kofleriaceae bacterium]|nr:ABC transporter ATP-binding protein [Kofleriaceae bacterium]
MTTTMSTAGIAARGLEKTFTTPRGEVRAVQHVDLAIVPGEIVALLGPNGAGKSTTIDLLLGLTAPDRGTVTLFGRTPAEAVAAGEVAAMLQTGGLVRDLTVRELVGLLASLYPAPRPVEEVLAVTGLDELADRRTQRLSGGQVQRVRFALALVAGARLIVLDEPTVAMDVDARRALWATVRTVAARGTTVLFATHYLEEADAHADRIVLIAHGRVVADGPATEIKARVGQRTIKATLPGAELAALRQLPGVTGAERRGDAVVLTCSDSDRAVRALLGAFDPRDLEIAGADLERAFVALTAEPPARRAA